MAAVGCARKASCMNTANTTIVDLDENPTRLLFDDDDVLRLIVFVFCMQLAGDQAQ